MSSANVQMVILEHVETYGLLRKQHSYEVGLLPLNLLLDGARSRTSRILIFAGTGTAVC